MQYYFGEPYICWCVQSHPEDRGDFGQGSTENISECNNLLELGVYNMWCSNMVLTNPHMKFRIEFIIMKIFMKLVKICPKSPRFTVPFENTSLMFGPFITILFHFPVYGCLCDWFVVGPYHPQMSCPSISLRLCLSSFPRVETCFNTHYQNAYANAFLGDPCHCAAALRSLTRRAEIM